MKHRTRNFHIGAALVICVGSLAVQAGTQMRVQPGVARPGDPVLVTVRGVESLPEGALGQKPLLFHPIPGGFQALAGLPVDMPPGSLEVVVKIPSASMDASADPSELIGSLDVEDPHYPARELTVAGKYISPPAKVKAWIAEDKKEFAKAFKRKPVARLFSQNFDWPRRAVVTAPFGDLRLFNGKKQSQHYGTDIDGKTGTPAFAANDGTVVMVRECYGSGNTVLIHHGLDLYTAYFHLSKFEVKQGQKVKQGQQLGLIGKTGRVTGPHLHWGVKVQGLWVNAESLLRLDFE
jgi:hypothetical protein